MMTHIIKSHLQDPYQIVSLVLFRFLHKIEQKILAILKVLTSEHYTLHGTFQPAAALPSRQNVEVPCSLSFSRTSDSLSIHCKCKVLNMTGPLYDC